MRRSLCAALAVVALTCHPQPYRMLRRERRVTHQEMDAGRSCGVRHDGDAERCDRCHAGEEVKP